MREIGTLLAGLFDSPDQYSEHLHRFVLLSLSVILRADGGDGLLRYTTSVMMEVVYGHTVAADGDRYMHIASEALRGTTEVAAAGANVVDFMPSREPLALPPNSCKTDTLKLQYAIYPHGCLVLVSRGWRMRRVVR